MAKQKVDEKEIIAHALQIFKEKSYHNTSMSDIAAACGILKGSLYHYFPSKEHLMQKVIVMVHEYFKENVFVHAYKTDVPAIERLKQMIEESEKIFFDRVSGSLMGNIGVETALVIPEFADSIRVFFKDFFTAIKEVYLDKYPEKIAAELAERSVAEVEGSIMLSRIFNEQTYLKNTHKRLLNRIED